MSDYTYEELSNCDLLKYRDLHFLTPSIACDYSRLASVNSVTCTSVAPIVAKLANSIVWKRKVNWMNVVRGVGEHLYQTRTMKFSLRYAASLLCVMKKGGPFLKKVSFYMTPSHHVLTDKGTRGWKGISHPSQQRLNNHVSQCCEAAFVALAPGVKSCHSQGKSTKEKIWDFIH